MKICIAQTSPVKGDVEKNILRHKELINVGISSGIDFIIFPELSLTGFEPELAKELATDPTDKKFDEFQQSSDAGNIIIGVGMPTKNGSGICISMILFQPHQPRKVYSKLYLHADEYPYFVNGKDPVYLTDHDNKIALAICNDTSIPEHSQNAFDNGANIYVASTLHYVKKINQDISRMAGIAKKYEMTVLMSNFVGQSGGYDCAGRSSVWNREGQLIGQLNDIDEGILILDTATNEITEKIMNTGN